MTKPRLLLTALVATLCLSGSSAFAGGEGWTADYKGAQTQAAEQSKDLLLDFTGSDWCGWCIRLNNEVFSQDGFKSYADENFVLVELDFPNDKSKLSEQTQAQNEELRKRFEIGGYPTVYLADESGKPYAITGYQRGGPEAYVEHLKELKQKRVMRDKHMAQAKSAEGIKKAKHLHAAMQAVGDDIAIQHYKEAVAQIIELDADNQAGLKKHYVDVQTAKAQEIALWKIMRMARQDPNAALVTINELINDPATITPVLQNALAFKSRIYLLMIKDRPAAEAPLRKAIAVDPDSERAVALKRELEHLFGGDDAKATD